jgi:hypothetical protein
MTTRKLFVAVVLTLAVIAPRPVHAQVCLSGVPCVTNVLTGPTTVSVDPNLGATLTLGSNNLASFSFTSPVFVWLRSVTAARMVAATATLCGPAGFTAGGIAAAGQPCMLNSFGNAVTIHIAPLDAAPLTSTGFPAGYWNLYAMHTTGNMAEAPLPHTVQFVPAAVAPVPAPAPSPGPTVNSWSVVPSLTGKSQCVPAGNTIVTINMNGANFDAGARLIVSYIYFVDRGTFITMNGAYDSRIGASMQSIGPTFLQGTVSLPAIHSAGHDTYGVGGNYYVQVQNGDGKLDVRAPNYFTVQPYSGGDSRCN